LDAQWVLLERECRSCSERVAGCRAPDRQPRPDDGWPHCWGLSQGGWRGKTENQAGPRGCTRANGRAGHENPESIERARDASTYRSRIPRAREHQRRRAHPVDSNTCKAPPRT